MSDAFDQIDNMGKQTQPQAQPQPATPTQPQDAFDAIDSQSPKQAPAQGVPTGSISAVHELPSLIEHPIESSISAITHPSQWAKEAYHTATAPLADSAIGYALESHLPKLSDALGLHPRETVYSPEIEAHKHQLVSPESLISPNSQDIGVRAARGVLGAAGSLATPENLTIIAATQGLGLFADVPAVSTMQRLISAGFGYQMIKGAISRTPEIKEAIKTGDYATAAELISKSGTEVAFAAGAVKHAAGDVYGEHQGRIEVDDATKKLLQDRLDTRKADVADAVAEQSRRTYFRPTPKKIAGVDVPVLAAQQENAPLAAKVAAKLATPGKADQFMEEQTRPAATEAAVQSVSQMAARRATEHTALRTGEPAPSVMPRYATVDDARAALDSTAKPTYQKADDIDARERAEWEAKQKVATQEYQSQIDEHNKQIDEYNSTREMGSEPLEHAVFNPENVAVPERPKFLSDLRSAEDTAWQKAKSADARERQEAYDKDIPKAEKDIDNWFKQHGEEIPEAEYTSAKDLTFRSKRLMDVASSLRAPMLNGKVSSSTLNGIEAKIDNQAIRRGQAPGAFRRLLGDEGYQNWKQVAEVLKPGESGKVTDTHLGIAAFSIGMMSHMWGAALGLAIPMEFARKFILDRALFNPEFGKWFTGNFKRFKSTGGTITPDMVNSLDTLMNHTKMSSQDLKDAGFTQEEIAKGAHLPIVGENPPDGGGMGTGAAAGTRLSQGAAPRRAPMKATDTPEFKQWFGDSKTVDEEGQPKVLYHGTTHNFNTFEPERGNIENHFGKGIYFTDSPNDVSANYAGEGPDLTNRIEQRAEQLMNEDIDEHGVKTPEDYRRVAKAEIAGEHGGVAMPVHVKMENPFEISQQRGKGTHFEINVDEDGKESGSGLKLHKAIQQTAGEYGLDPDELWGKVVERLDLSDFSAARFDSELTLALDELAGDRYTEEGNVSSELKRKIYQAAGFDGIIVTASDAFPHMKGIPKGTKHYVAFEPTQVKSAIGNSGAFDPSNPDIRLSQSTNRAGDDLSYHNDPAGLEGSNIHHRVETRDIWGDKIGELTAQDTKPGEITIRSNQIYDEANQGAGRGSDQLRHLLGNVSDDTHVVKSDISTTPDARRAWGSVMREDPDSVTKKTYPDGQTQYTVDMDKYRSGVEEPVRAIPTHPITHDMVRDAFPGQQVTKLDDNTYKVDLDNGQNIRVELKDVVDNGGVVVRPGNAVLGRWDRLENGGVMQLAGISSEATLGHEVAHAGFDLLPKRLQDAVLNKFGGDEEKFADWFGDNREKLERGKEPDTLFGQVKSYFQDLYEKIFKPAQYAMRQIHEGKVWDTATEVPASKLAQIKPMGSPEPGPAGKLTQIAPAPQVNPYEALANSPAKKLGRKTSRP